MITGHPHDVQALWCGTCGTLLSVDAEMVSWIFCCWGLGMLVEA